MPEPVPSLHELIDNVDQAAEAPVVTVDDILDALGTRSFAPAVLLPSLVLVSPLSGIPGISTMGAIMVVLVTAQWLFETDHLWLPGWVLNREIRSRRLRRGLRGLANIAGWIDARSCRRLVWLTTGPMRAVVKISILLIALFWPLLEILPMVTTFGAATVSLMALGLWVRDGLIVVLGYGMACAGAFGLIQLADAMV